MSYYVETKNTHEIRELYRKFKEKGGTATVQPSIKVKATEKGISGLKAFKIVNVDPNNTNGKHAIDGKKSTAFKGKSLTVDINGVGETRGLGIKFKGGPYSYKLESSFNNRDWFEIPALTSTFKKNQFDIFEFSVPLPTQYIRISSSKTIEIITVEVLGEIMGKPPVVPTPTPPGPVIPQKPTPIGGLDEFGIKLLATPKAGGRLITEMDYKRSSHNTGTRDTFSKKGADMTAMQVMGYYNMSLSKGSEELSYKVFGGTHSDSAKKQGQCYSFGAEQTGGPSLKKEYPEHPTTPDFSDEAQIQPGMPDKLKSLKNRWIGLAGIIWADKVAKEVHISVYVDDDGLIGGKPANNWKLWWTFTDDGSTMKGPAFMENQGVKNGGDALFYMRIDTVTKKTDTYGVSCREIIPPNP